MINYVYFFCQLLHYFRSRRWGPRSPSAHAWWVRSSPHRHKRKFTGARLCRVTYKHLHQPLRCHIRSFGTLGQIFKIPPLSAQICHSAGSRGGVPNHFFWLECSYFCYLGARAKFQNPMTAPSGRISNEPRRREREKMPYIVATYVSASCQISEP